MYVNGSTLDDKTFQRISEYVQHEDVFVPTQTLEDALFYHCHLRLGPSIPLSEKKARIEGLVHEAGLSDKMHTRYVLALPPSLPASLLVLSVPTQTLEDAFASSLPDPLRPLHSSL